MKKIGMALLALLMISSLLLVSCNKDGEEGEPIYYTVTFDSKGGGEVDPRQVLENTLMGAPSDPVREGYMFLGWYYGSVLWDFSLHEVQGDVLLEAKWIANEQVFAFSKLEGTDTVEITGLKNWVDHMIVPSVLSGYTVVRIGDGVFADRTEDTIKSLTIPHTVTSIGEGAFRNMQGVKLVFDENCVISELGEQAFLDCTSLTRIRLGEGLEKIPYEAFSGCTELENISLPKSVTVIEESAFLACSSLQYVMLHENVEMIQDSAFQRCNGLKSVFYYGNGEQLDALRNEKTSTMNDSFKECKAYVYSADEPNGTGTYPFWYLDENRNAKVW